MNLTGKKKKKGQRTSSSQVMEAMKRKCEMEDRDSTVSEKEREEREEPEGGVITTPSGTEIVPKPGRGSKYRRIGYILSPDHQGATPPVV